MIMRIIVYCSSKTMSQKSPTELYEKVAKTREDACSEKWSKARHSREMERERRVWGAKWGVFWESEAWDGDKGQRGEKEGRDALSSHCIPTRHIPVHIWLQYTRSPLLTIPHSLSQTHKSRICTGTHVDTQTHQNTHTQETIVVFFPCSSEKSLYRLLSLSYLIKLLSSRAAVVTQFGGWRYSKLPHFLGDSALLHVPMRSQGNLIPIFRGCSHTEEQEVQRRLNLRMCVVPSASMHVSLEGREAGSGGPSCAGENDEAGSWDVERQVDGPRDTDWLSPLRVVQWQVGASIKNHATHACAAVGTLGSSTVWWSVCLCSVCFLTVKVVVPLFEGGL